MPLLKCVSLTALMTMAAMTASSQTNLFAIKPGRSVVRAQHGMVATSQPLASQVGLEVLKRGGNAVDAAIAVAAMLNVTEPMMTGVGGDAFVMVYWSKTGELKGLNASGRAPKALTLEHFQQKGLQRIPIRGMESISVPGAFDGWVTLLNRYGTMKLADLLQPAISYAENGFPLMEKTAEDWNAEVEVLKRDPASTATYLIDGRAPKTGEIFRNPKLAQTLRTLASGGRDALYNGPVGREMVAYFQQHGGYISMEDLAAQHSEWVDPISTDYRGYKVFEMPPNSQGITALIALNILENFDLRALAQQPDAYYHTEIEALKLAFADRNRYIADPKFAKVPVQELLSKQYARQRAALIRPDSAIQDPQPGTFENSSPSADAAPAGADLGSTTYFTVVDKDHNAVSFINSLYEHFGSGVTAGDTGVMMQDRGSQFSLDPSSPNVIAPGKRPFHTIIPAMVFKDGKPLFSFGVMGGNMQPQGHVEVLTRIIDLGMGLQEAIDGPRFRYDGGARVIMEDAMGADVIAALERRGHKRATVPNVRSAMGGAQLIMIDPQTGALAGASDPRKDGQAVGW